MRIAFGDWVGVSFDAFVGDLFHSRLHVTMDLLPFCVSFFTLGVVPRYRVSLIMV